jgi:hypothetical protein
MCYKIWKIIRLTQKVRDETEREPVVLKIRFNGDSSG